MKKSQRKKQKTEKRKIRETNVDLGDLGLEPPKIYRDAQRQSMNASQKRQKNSSKVQQLTRHEKRQKDNKKRKKRNTLRKFTIWLLVIITLLAVGVVLSLTVFFNITDVTVVGESSKYASDEILAQCPIDVGENLFLADTENAKAMLEQNLPYIYKAEIKRQLPYTIEIHITDATPAYSIKNEDKTFILLDDNFKVLENKAEKAEGISIQKAVVVNANPGTRIEFEDEDISSCLNKLSAVVKDNDFEQITAIYSNNVSDNYVVYEGRIDFKLGTCDDLENKIYQGMAACDKLNQSNPNAKGTMNISGGKSIYFTEK